MSGAFFVPLGGGRYRATEHASGPWDPRHQHGGPPSALLTGLLERTAPREDMELARLTVEILGPVPVGEVEASAEVVRPGRSVELLEGELRAGGRPALRARAWRVLRAPLGTPAEAPPALPEPSDAPSPRFGYGRAVEWRWASGGWIEPGPAQVWTRLRVAIVEGEEPTPRQRVVAVADSANGVSNVLDFRRHLFIPPELTVHFLRAPAGEWILLDARTEIEAGGAGLSTAALSDRTGVVARSAQALLVGPRT